MAERRITVSAMGTYYTDAAIDDGRASEDAKDWRKLIYLAKAARPSAETFVRHEWHPEPTLQHKCSNSKEACSFVGKALGYFLAQKQFASPVLVPIPSSDVTKETLNTARWAARDIANAAIVSGPTPARVSFCVVNKEKTGSGENRSARAVSKNLVILPDAQISAEDTIVYIDDTMTRGRNLTAVDLALRKPSKAHGFVIGITSKEYRESAAIPYERVLRYSDLDDIRNCPDEPLKL